MRLTLETLDAVSLTQTLQNRGKNVKGVSKICLEWLVLHLESLLWVNKWSLRGGAVGREHSGAGRQRVEATWLPECLASQLVRPGMCVSHWLPKRISSVILARENLACYSGRLSEAGKRARFIAHQHGRIRRSIKWQAISGVTFFFLLREEISRLDVASRNAKRTLITSSKQMAVHLRTSIARNTIILQVSRTSTKTLIKTYSSTPLCGYRKMTNPKQSQPTEIQQPKSSSIQIFKK